MQVVNLKSRPVGLENFVAQVCGDLGDRRRIARATQYVEALLTRSSEPKTFAQLARLVTPDDDEETRYKTEQSFQHLINGSSWEADDVLRPLARMIRTEIDVKATMLLAVVSPRLGEHEALYPDPRAGGRQIASVIQFVGFDGDGDPVVLPIRWKLSLEDQTWQDRKMRERAEVDYPVGVHISALGSEHVTTVLSWGILDKEPLVAGPSYDWLRGRWLQRERWPRYVVEIPEKAVWDSDEQLETLLGTRPDQPQLRRLRFARPKAASFLDGRWRRYELKGGLGLEQVLVKDATIDNGSNHPRAWCTNITGDRNHRLVDVLRLTQLRECSRGAWDEIRYGTLGAAGYRGLSVKGWSRHCALVSVAQAWRIRAGLAKNPEKLNLPEGRLPDERNWREDVRTLWS